MDSIQILDRNAEFRLGGASMSVNVLLVGEKIALRSITNEFWHEYWKNYVADPMMDETPYVYDEERIEKAYLSKTSDETRLYFAVMLKEQVIGMIYLKHIDRAAMQAEFGIALVDDAVKGKGYGTEAIRLLLEYAFAALGFQTIIAGSVLRNTRSRYVLEKAGFRYTHEDDVFRYYRIEKRVLS